MRRQRILGGLVLLAVTAAVLLGVKLFSPETETKAAAEWVTVPLEGAQSPDGAYEVRWETLGKNGAEADIWPGTRLEVVNRSTGHVLWESRGERGAAALWSPDGKYLALTRQTENDSVVTILETAYFHAFEVLWDLDAAVSKTALEWMNADTLRVRYLWAETGEAAVCLCTPVPRTDGSISGEYLWEETNALPGTYDFDHDGLPETAEIMMVWEQLAGEGLVFCELRVRKADGSLLWSDWAETSHAGWNSLFACEIGGQDYLLRYLTAMYQGSAAYCYEVFSLDAAGQETPLREDSVEFDTNFGSPLHQGFAPEEIADFLWDLRGCLADSRLLISTEGGEFHADGEIPAAELPALFCGILALDSREAMLEALRQDEAEMKAEQGIA
nr:hypothetical protein [uncultured Dysosmobacter sp.]